MVLDEGNGMSLMICCFYLEKSWSFSKLVCCSHENGGRGNTLVLGVSVCDRMCMIFATVL